MGVAAIIGVSIPLFVLGCSWCAHRAFCIAEEYFARSVDEAGGRNVVNVILVDFRGFDTMGEITVLGNCCIGCCQSCSCRRAASPRICLCERGCIAMIQSKILEELVDRWLTKVATLVAIFITFRGHNAPGGGFAGGLILGAAFVLQYLAGQQPLIRRKPILHPERLLGAGLLLALATTIAPLFVGGSPLESYIWTSLFAADRQSKSCVIHVL
jgi:multisubunit Na+/H+ antiporter MnhB subunit